MGFSTLGILISGSVLAGVLPEDRADVLYHLYQGDGVEIDGSSILVRKQLGKSISLVGNYYVDMVSSASIDVITTASPYTEERKQWSLGMDYLRGNTTMRVGYTSSAESDFDAKTYSFSVSQDMFGDLLTGQGADHSLHPEEHMFDGGLLGIDIAGHMYGDIDTVVDVTISNNLVYYNQGKF